MLCRGPGCEHADRGSLAKLAGKAVGVRLAGPGFDAEKWRARLRPQREVSEAVRLDDDRGAARSLEADGAARDVLQAQRSGFEHLRIRGKAAPGEGRPPEAGAQQPLGGDVR